MKNRFALIAFVVMVALTAGMQASDSTKAVVASYLDIQAALASDKIDTVKPAAAAIAKEAARMGAAGEAIRKAATAIGSAADLKAAREAFGPLSDAVIAAAKADGWKDLPGLKVGYCPMVGKSWMQKKGQVSNPYYGSTMLTCGELKDTLKDAKK